MICRHSSRVLLQSIRPVRLAEFPSLSCFDILETRIPLISCLGLWDILVRDKTVPSWSYSVNQM